MPRLASQSTGLSVLLVVVVVVPVLRALQAQVLVPDLRFVTCLLRALLSPPGGRIAITAVQLAHAHCS